MLDSKPVRTPEAPGKITFSSRSSGAVYVLYEYARVYDPKRKFNVPKRASIGRLAAASDRTWMYPNKNYARYFGSGAAPQAAAAAAPEPAKRPLPPPGPRSLVQQIGPYIVIRSVVRKSGLGTILKSAFGRAAGALLDVAQYLILNGGPTLDGFSLFARRHPLFDPDARLLTDRSLLRLLSQADEEEVAHFLHLWNEGRDRRQRICITSDAADPTLNGRPLEISPCDDPAPEMNGRTCKVGIAFDARNRMPLFFSRYAGVGTFADNLRFMASEAERFNYERVAFVLAHGAVSKEALEWMDAQGVQFLMRAESASRLATGLLKPHLGTFERNPNHRIPGTDLHGKTVEGRLFEGDRKTRQVHLIFDPCTMAAERQRFEEVLLMMREHLKSVAKCGIDWKIQPPYSRYFQGVTRTITDEEGRTRTIFAGAEEKADAIRERLMLCGCACLISSEKMSAAEACSCFQALDARDAPDGLINAGRPTRDVCETDDDDMDAFDEPSDNAQSGFIFAQFLALIIRALIEEKLSGLAGQNHPKSTEEAMRELEMIEAVLYDDGIHRLPQRLSAVQKDLLEAFELDESDLQRLTADLDER